MYVKAVFDLAHYTKLKQTEMPIIDRTQCNNTGDISGFVTDKYMICAGLVPVKYMTAHLPGLIPVTHKYMSGQNLIPVTHKLTAHLPGLIPVTHKLMIPYNCLC